MINYLRKTYGAGLDIKIREIRSGRVARLRLMCQVLCDAILRRRDPIYFCSFVSAPFASIAALLRHPRWIYHSQDWILDRPGVASRLERIAIRGAPIVIWNEAHRAEEARKRAGRRGDVLVLPTYLPRTYPVPALSAATRAAIARLAGADPKLMVVIFAGGSYSYSRLSPQLLDAAKTLDTNTVIVFTGPSRLPAEQARPGLIDMGLLDYDDMLEVMASSDVGLLLYDHANAFGHRYQQPGRLTEYLRAGLRLVATPFPDAKRLANTTRFCLVAEGYDVDELGETLRETVKRVRGEKGRGQIRGHAEREMVYDPHAERVVKETCRRLGINSMAGACR